jgi:hypothetical protein
MMLWIPAMTGGGVEWIVVHLIAPSEKKVKFLKKTPSEEKIIVHEREV